MKRSRSNTRGNGAGLAAAANLAEAWHGRAPHQVTEVTEVTRSRTDFADLAGLEELVVITGSGYECTLRFGHDVRVCGAVDPGDDVCRQIYFVGGDQELNLKSLEIYNVRDKVDVGRVRSITYHTRKDHLEGTPGSYEHQFGEEGGEEPLLVYDTLNHRLELVGGSYEIAFDDYDGRHSAGIRD